MDIKLLQGETFNVKNSTGETVLSVGNASTDTVQEKLVSGTNIKTINNESILGSGDIDTKEIFVATYGTTTYDEVSSAITDGKTVIVKYNGLTHYLVSNGIGMYKFACPYGDSISFVYVGDRSGWVNETASLTAYEEIRYSSLVSKRNSSGLTKGKWYRITDYNTTTVQSNTQAAGHQFDILVLATDVNKLSEEARAIRHTGDTYFSASTLDAWGIKYCLDNDTNKYAWADSGSTGRGVIYYMKDEWNNECPYDFKNIQFARWEQTNPIGYVYDEEEWEYVQDSDQSWVSGYNLKAGFYSTDGSSNDDNLGQYKKKISYTVSSTPTYCYTFGRGLDASLGKNVYGNVIKEYHQSNKLQLNNIVFLQTTLTQNCHSNTFGKDCGSNTFGNNCEYNTFGNNCGSNTFGKDCGSNTFGNDCEYNTFEDNCEYNTFRTCGSNTFGNNCRSNTFGNNCQSNTFGSNCFSNTFGDYGQSNIFGNNCQGNTFGNYSHSNTFGNSCSYNTLGNYSQSNTFGNSCQDNAFGNNCESNTFGESVQYFITGNATGATTSAQTKDYIRCLIVENGVRSVNAYCTGTTSDSNYCQNIKIGLGLKGARSSNRLQINITSQIGAVDSVTYQTTNARVVNI